MRELTRRLINAYNRRARQSRASKDDPFARVQAMWDAFNGSGQFIDVIASDNNPGSDDVVVLRDERPIPPDVTSLAMARGLAPTRSDVPTMVPLDRLSSGQKALFAFAQPLIFRDTPVDFVIIDEPEQHLHVRWHRILREALRKLAPQAQFLVATHSEDILTSVRSYQRFILVAEDDPRARLATAAE